MDPLATTPPQMPPANGERDKYIRTFASDMEIYQRGGTPGLAPLKTPAPSSTPGPVAAPLPPVPQESSVTYEQNTESEPFYATPSVRGTETPVPLPPTPEPGFMQASAASREKHVEPDVSPAPLKTYLEDFRVHMKDTHASTASILAAEQDAGPTRAEPLPEEPESPSKNRWYIGIGVALLIISAVGVYLSYGHYLSSLAPVLVASGPEAPIFVDSRATVSGTGIVLMQEIKKSIEEPLPLGTVRLLSLDVATSSVFTALKVSAPGTLLRNVDAPGSIAGVVNTKTGQGPFFILKVSSYGSTFSGMLAWEPMMQAALAAIFPLYPSATPAATSSVATTTATTTSPAATSSLFTTLAPSTREGFHDETVSNHDVRVYRDLQGRSILLYGYWNQSTLIIARDPAAFAELLARLATSHT